MRTTHLIRSGTTKGNLVSSSAGYADRRHTKKPPVAAEVSMITEKKEEEAGVKLNATAESAQAMDTNGEEKTTTPQGDRAKPAKHHENGPVRKPENLFAEPTLFSPRVKGQNREKEALSQKKRNAHAKLLQKRETYSKVLQELEKLKDPELRLIAEYNKPLSELVRRLMEKNQSVFLLEPEDIYAFFVQEGTTGERLLESLGKIREQAESKEERATSKLPEKYPFKCKITGALHLLSGKVYPYRAVGRLISDEEIEMLLNIPGAVHEKHLFNNLYLVKTQIGDFWLPLEGVINTNQEVQSAISELEAVDPASPGVDAAPRESSHFSTKSPTSIAQLKSRAQNMDEHLVSDPAYSNRISSTQPNRAIERNLVTENRILGKKREARLTTKSLQDRIGSITETRKKAQQRASKKAIGSKRVQENLNKKRSSPRTLDRIKNNKILNRKRTQSGSRPNVKSLLMKGESRMKRDTEANVNRTKISNNFIPGYYKLKEDFEIDGTLLAKGTVAIVTEQDNNEKLCYDKISEIWIPYGLIIKID